MILTCKLPRTIKAFEMRFEGVDYLVIEKEQLAGFFEVAEDAPAQFTHGIITSAEVIRHNMPGDRIFARDARGELHHAAAGTAIPPDWTEVSSDSIEIPPEATSAAPAATPPTAPPANPPCDGHSRLKVSVSRETEKPPTTPGPGPLPEVKRTAPVQDLIRAALKDGPMTTGELGKRIPGNIASTVLYTTLGTLRTRGEIITRRDEGDGVTKNFLVNEEDLNP